MAGPVDEESADNEYMTMDADQWLENDDIYENGDTLGPAGGENSQEQKSEPPSREKLRETLAQRRSQNTQNLNAAQNSIHPLPDRYLTMRRPPMNSNKGSKHLRKLVFFKKTAAFLVMIFLLALGLLLGLSLYFDRLDEDHRRETKLDMIRQENENLKEQVDLLKNQSRSIYHIFSRYDSDCSAGFELFVINYEDLEWQLNWDSFYLGRKIRNDRTCSLFHYCKCTRMLK